MVILYANFHKIIIIIEDKVDLSMLKQHRRTGTYTPEVSYGLFYTRGLLYPRTISFLKIIAIIGY
jgi:hypothetical protein